MLAYVNNALFFLTVWWLGLPVIAGTLLVLGTVRKEFILLALVAIYGTTNLIQFLTPVQLVTLAFIGMIYIPCISTVAVLAKEFNWKTAAVMTLANVAAAIFIGGLAYRILAVLL